MLLELATRGRRHLGAEALPAESGVDVNHEGSMEGPKFREQCWRFAEEEESKSYPGMREYVSYQNMEVDDDKI